MMWLLQALAVLAYLASLALIVVIVNIVVLAVALWIRHIATGLRKPPAATDVYSSPRARAGVAVPPSAPAPAGRIEPEWWLR